MLTSTASLLFPVYFGFLPTLGFGELAILFVIVLILFGPGKLPQVAKALGESINQFKNASKDAPTNPDEKPAS